MWELTWGEKITQNKKLYVVMMNLKSYQLLTSLCNGQGQMYAIEVLNAYDTCPDIYNMCEH